MPAASSSALYLALASASSFAFSSSDFSLGATYMAGAKSSTEKSKLVLIPDRFFRMNFWLDVLFIVQLGKFNIYRTLLIGSFIEVLLNEVWVLFRLA